MQEMQNELEDLRDCGLGNCRPAFLQSCANIKVKKNRFKLLKKLFKNLLKFFILRESQKKFAFFKEQLWGPAKQVVKGKGSANGPKSKHLANYSLSLVFYFPKVEKCLFPQILLRSFPDVGHFLPTPGFPSIKRFKRVF